MQIETELSQQLEPCCIALGFFDGVHMGHRRIIDSMKEYAAEKHILSAVFTFSSSPAAALGKASSRSLMTADDKTAAFAAMNIDKCFIPDFYAYKNISADDFVEKILIKQLNAKALFCGYNYRFGKFAAGSCALLAEICEKYGVEVFVSAPVCSGDSTVSSSRIRDLIESGKMLEANSLMQSPFTISGAVAHGLENGRTVGIPTINQAIPEGFVVPRFGAYASFAVVDGVRYDSVTNIGTRPTVSGHGVNCETHILENFSGELYGRDVRTQLLWFERDEKKFGSLKELAKQISHDIEHINNLKIYELYKSGEYLNGSKGIG